MIFGRFQRLLAAGNDLSGKFREASRQSVLQVATKILIIQLFFYAFLGLILSFMGAIFPKYIPFHPNNLFSATETSYFVLIIAHLICALLM
jgi:hypothetical protein